MEHDVDIGACIGVTLLAFGYFGNEEMEKNMETTV